MYRICRKSTRLGYLGTEITQHPELKVEFLPSTGPKPLSLRNSTHAKDSRSPQ